MGRFHKALPNVKSTYVTLQDFTPDLQKIYTDISAISVTLCNSGSHLVIVQYTVYQQISLLRISSCVNEQSMVGGYEETHVSSGNIGDTCIDMSR